MKLLRYLKAHFIYSLDRKNIIINILFNIIILTVVLSISGIFNDLSIIDSKRETYYNLFNNNFYLIITIFYIFYIIVSSYIFFSDNYSIYSSYFIKDSKSKLYYYLSKYIFIYLYLIMEVILIYFIYMIIMIILPYGKIDINSFNYFIKLFHLGFYYFLLTEILINIFSSNLIVVITLLIYWLYNIKELIDNEKVKKLIEYISPNININIIDYSINKKSFYVILVIMIVINLIFIIKKR